MVTFRFESLVPWPHPETVNRKSRASFRAPWDKTLAALKREIAYHAGDYAEATIGAGFRAVDIRQDGMPRANAAAPLHPGVVIQFRDVENHPMTFSTDAYQSWQANVRAIMLAMAAMRAVDRYGATQGRQWAGFRNLLPAGTDEAVASRGRSIVLARFDGSVKRALKALHPDTGTGNRRDYDDVVAYKESL